MNIFDLRDPVSAGTHGLWFLLAFPATWLLWRRCGRDFSRRVSLLVFGFGAVFCFGASTLFHGARGTEATIRILETWDYVGIYFMIAGTATPVAWTLMRGRWRRNALRLVWLSAALGAALNLGLGTLPLPLSTAFYLAMGWGAVFGYFEAARLASHRQLRLIVVGGLFYTVGAALNLMEWPSLRPGVFGFHELFHLLVMAGSFCHFWFMLTVVAPFQIDPAALEVRTPLAEPRQAARIPTLVPIPVISDPPLNMRPPTTRRADLG